MGIIMTTKELRPRDPKDHYPTPSELVRAALNKINVPTPSRVMDPGSGAGVWGTETRRLWPDTLIVGGDIDTKYTPDMVDGRPYNAWVCGDYAQTGGADMYAPFDLILGNPPYRFAEQFVRRSWELLAPEGYLVFLLRLAFLEGQRRAKNFWPQFRPKDVLVCSRRPSFTGNAKTDATAYAVYVWRKGFVGPTYVNWLEWTYDQSDRCTDVSPIFEGLGQPA